MSYFTLVLFLLNFSTMLDLINSNLLNQNATQTFKRKRRKRERRERERERERERDEEILFYG